MANEMRDRKNDQTKNPVWVPLIHQAIDQTTGEIIKKYPNGYTCSRCGKHSWSKKEICDGCNSTMEQDGIRNRIVELLRQKTCIYASCDRECSGCGNISISDSDIEIIADYLIENGVVVPPCKVGDIVYQIMDIESVHRQVLELKVWRIEITESTIRFWCRTVKQYRYNFSELDIDDFGKTVFPTKEEAEKALKEGDENG